MKESFRGYYRLSDDEFEKLWDTALIVPDTSFLSTLYRLPAEFRKEMLNALRTVPDRLWVPHHVILEYLKNRPSIIADQKKKFSEVQNIIDDFHDKLSSDISKLRLKKRHSLIKTEQFEEQLMTLIESFKTEIAGLEKQHITYDSDELLDELFNLFKDKIGPAPKDQEEIDAIYKEAAMRYSKYIPPGYMDIDKSKKEKAASFEYGGIIYQRQYGDYLIWKQLLKHAADKNLKAVIFITDDAKEDWLLIVNKKKIGPRPELAEEICRIAGTNLFHIYSSEKFIEYANKYLELNVNAAALRVIKDITEISREDEDPLHIAAESPEDIAEDIIQELSWELVNSDETITGATAETNAYGWGLDVYEITRAEYDEEKQLISFSANVILTAEQDEDKPFCGDQLDVELSGTIEYDGDSFQLKEYCIESCKSNF